ncbi:BTAD domain-containing putative transcriptional regulator [Actinoplanes sp. N902-109]|uniref:AfsR/SARP family transcriptional regulator n=1 Tax=Actinoplanes sp. (strain N902-109) TaxID=649831 RepID=UPI0012F7AEE8|nr:BTAD domain-containing putative transcriptional regulator [Actinoplanes sp. N902-109]
MTAGLWLQVAGPLRLWRDGVEIDAGPRQQRRLLALLAVRGGQPASIADLIDLMWEDEAPASAVNIIHKYVGALRRIFEPDLRARTSGSFLVPHGTGYQFAGGPDVLDLAAFRELIGAAGRSAGNGEPAAALDHQIKALRLWHGSSGDSLADSTMAQAVFAAVDEEFFAAAIRAAELAAKTGRAAEVLAPIRLAAEIGQLNEPVHAALITTLAAVGCQAEALTVYQTIRGRLADELGIDPSPLLRKAHHQVLTQAVSAPVTPAEQLAVAAGRSRTFVRPAQLPPGHPLFVGRDAEIKTLRELCTRSRTDSSISPLVIAVDGMGGVGKSTLVSQVAHLLAGDYTDGQLYLDMRGHDDDGVSAGDALRFMLYSLGIPASEIPDGFDALAGTYRSLTAGQRILVLLDNVRDPSQVRPLLPNSAHSLVLITSRRPLVGLAASDGAHLLRADLPTPGEARQLLLARLARGRNRELTDGIHAETLDQLIESCGRLPLALAVIAAQLSARPQLSLNTVAAALRDDSSRLDAFPGRGGVSNPRTAFSWSYRQLTPGAARLFRLLAMALTPGISVDAAVSLAGRDRRQVRDELTELAEAALIDEDSDGIYSSHVLVKSYAKELLSANEPAAEQQAAISRLLQHYLHSAANARRLLAVNRASVELPAPPAGVAAEEPASYQEALDWFDRHRGVLKEAVLLAAGLGYGIVPWHLALTMQQYLAWQGFFADWEDVMRYALRDTRERSDEIGEGHVLRSLAGARWYAGANEEALELLGGARDIFAAHGMPAEQAAVFTDLHAVHTTLGRHDLALAASEEALALTRSTGDIRAELRCLDCQGQSLIRLGRHEEAERATQRTLALNRRLEYQHEDISTRVVIARNLASVGRVEDAMDQLRQAAESAGEMHQGPNRFTALRVLSELLVSAEDASGAWRAYGDAEQVLTSLQDGGPERLRGDLHSLQEQVTRLRPDRARRG